jgi:hypothetical protein
MKDPVPVRKLLAAIRKLPADKPLHTPGKWYLTQHEHWIGWLSEYNGPGAYGRDASVERDAKFAYNHIVEPEMLLYLAGAVGVQRKKVSEARNADSDAKTLMQRAGVVRKHLPWPIVAAALWSDYQP